MTLHSHAWLSNVVVTHPCFVWRSDALISAAIPYNRETRVCEKTVNSHSTLLWYALCCEFVLRDAVLDAASDASLWTVSHQRVFLCNPHAVSDTLHPLTHPDTVCPCSSDAMCQGLSHASLCRASSYCTAQEDLKCWTVLSGAEAPQLLWHVKVASLTHDVCHAGSREAAVVHNLGSRHSHGLVNRC